jgi:16S rRNA (cytidine1402-2'-O)-methyltransferase
MKDAVSGTLFVVATPIGNLEDITLRALRILREVALVAAEDTRRTGNLLRHYDITTPLLSLHEHNEYRRRAELIARLQAGDSIALVSDAGTPGISDPGATVVRAARDAGLRVESIPGPSAITALLSASGLSFDRFAFAGFPPIRSKDRKQWFEWVGQLKDVPVVAFEAPHRVQRTLTELGVYFGSRPILLGRELTKIHEEWREGRADEFGKGIDSPRGEFALVLAPVVGDPEPRGTPPDSLVAEMFGQITESTGDSRRAAVKQTAERLAISPKAVYAALERHKISVD